MAFDHGIKLSMPAVALLLGGYLVAGASADELPNTKLKQGRAAWERGMALPHLEHRPNSGRFRHWTDRSADPSLECCGGHVSEHR